MNWPETFRIWAKSEEHQERVQQAKNIIRSAFEHYRKPYIAWSGGKDSTCVVHLVLQNYPDTMVLHWDYGRYYIPREIHSEIMQIARRMKMKIRVETSAEYERLGRRAINVLGREMIGKLIPQLAGEGYDCVFVGLRKEESVKRKLRILSQRNLSVIDEIFPVQDWRWLDVWAYIFSNNVPYLSHYDKYGQAIGWDKARFTTLFDPEFDKFGCSNVDGVLSWRYRYIEREK